MIRIEKSYRGCDGNVETNTEPKVRCNGVMWARNGIMEVTTFYQRLEEQSEMTKQGGDTLFHCLYKQRPGNENSEDDVQILE